MIAPQVGEMVLWSRPQGLWRTIGKESGLKQLSPQGGEVQGWYAAGVGYYMMDKLGVGKCCVLGGFHHA